MLILCPHWRLTNTAKTITTQRILQPLLEECCNHYYYLMNTATTTISTPQILQSLSALQEYCNHYYYFTNVAITITTQRMLQSLSLLQECFNHYNYSTNSSITITTLKWLRFQNTTLIFHYIRKHIQHIWDWPYPKIIRFTVGFLRRQHGDVRCKYLKHHHIMQLLKNTPSFLCVNSPYMLCWYLSLVRVTSY